VDPASDARDLIFLDYQPAPQTIEDSVTSDRHRIAGVVRC